MGTKIEEQDYLRLSKAFNIPVKNIKTIVKVESGGHGFDATTGKILIQFEPAWFKKKAEDPKHGEWELNKVDVQTKEWQAFNSAFIIDREAAMESTSWGMMQVMGFHWKNLGFKSIGEFVDYMKVSEANQIDVALRFIKLNKKLYDALVANEWATVALYYNGKNYKDFKYDTRLEAAYKSL